MVPQRLVLGAFNTFLLGAGSLWPGLDARQELAATPEVSQVPGVRRSVTLGLSVQFLLLP